MTLQSLKTTIHRNRWLYGLYRQLIMTYRRRRYRLRHVHRTFYLAGPDFLSPDLEAGPYSFVNRDSYVGPYTQLGAYVMLAPRVAVVVGDHRFDIPGVPIIFSGRPELKRTVIEDDACVGYGVVILAGVHIGAGSHHRRRSGGDSGRACI